MLMTYPLRFIGANIRRTVSRPSKPFLLNYSITFRCNMRCSFCGCRLRRYDKTNNKELAAEEIKYFLQDKQLRNLDVIVISGGEPFIKEDLEDILLAFKRCVSPSIFHITTNGYYSERIVNAISYLKGEGLKIDLKVSIDDIGDRHDALRNTEGSFKKAVYTIEKLRKKFSRKKLYIGVNQTLTENNFRSAQAVKRIADQYDVDYRCFIALEPWPVITGCPEKSYNVIALSSEAKKNIQKTFQKIYFDHRTWIMSAEWLESIVLRHYVRGQLQLLTKKHKKHCCMNLFTHFRLNPNGNMVTCSYDNDTLGNIRTESYTSITQKPLFKEKLNMVKKCGNCWLGCEVAPNWVSSLCRF